LGCDKIYMARCNKVVSGVMGAGVPLPSIHRASIPQVIYIMAIRSAVRAMEISIVFGKDSEMNRLRYLEK